MKSTRSQIVQSNVLCHPFGRIQLCKPKQMLVGVLPSTDVKTFAHLPADPVRHIRTMLLRTPGSSHIHIRKMGHKYLCSNNQNRIVPVLAWSKSLIQSSKQPHGTHTMKPLLDLRSSFLPYINTKPVPLKIRAVHESC